MGLSVGNVCRLSFAIVVDDVRSGSSCSRPHVIEYFKQMSQESSNTFNATAQRHVPLCSRRANSNGEWLVANVERRTPWDF
jgi:hypothetical protein